MRKNDYSKNNFQIVKTKNLKMQTNLLFQKVSQWLPEEEVITKGQEEISGVMDISIVLIVGMVS